MSQTYTNQLNNALDNLDTIFKFVSQDITFEELNKKVLEYPEFKNVLVAIKDLQIKVQSDNIDEMLLKSLSYDDARSEIYQRLIAKFKHNPQASKSIRSAWVKNLSANEILSRAERFEDGIIIKECKTILANIRKDVVVVEPESKEAAKSWYKKLFKL